jgi:hypothetical protein
MPDLMELARAKWRSSGLSDEQAEKLQFQALDREDVRLLGGNFQCAHGLKIPYFDAEGNLSTFYRLRYLEPLPGFAAQATKPQRYVQPSGTLNEVYMPPLLEHSWASVQRDPKVPVYITEGELKAAAGCSAGLATLGLGGVDVWRSAKKGLEVLPQLGAFEWKNRTVTIIYDSDAATNENVVRAQRQLAQELTVLGAIPQIASLPATAEGKKQGLDDFLVANGKEALLEVLGKAPSFPEADALWELNEEVAYIRDPGLVVVRSSNQKLAPSAFVNHSFANRHYMEMIQTKKGTRQERKPLAKRWMEWEHRFELSRITYEPGREKMVGGRWNQWAGWGTYPEEGDIQPWVDLLDFLFKKQKDAREWFEKWLAYPIQHPGTKMYTAAVLWGVEHGTGKTLIAYIMRRIYGDNFVEIKNKHLKGGFNEWSENKQFVYGDEITGNDGKRTDADLIKGLITQEIMRVNAKYVPSYEIPDCVNYYLSSNHPDTVFLEDTDRRFFVHEVIGKPHKDFEFYKRIDSWLRGSGPRHLFKYLLDLDLAGFDPHAPALNTTSKQAMIRDNKSDIGVWVMRLREDPDSALNHFNEKVRRECDLFTPTMLLEAYDSNKDTKVTVNGLSRELKRSSFRQVNDGNPVRTAMGLQRLYAIRNCDKWDRAEPRECAEHFDKFWTGGKF